MSLIQDIINSDLSTAEKLAALGVAVMAPSAPEGRAEDVDDEYRRHVLQPTVKRTFVRTSPLTENQ